ncbi:MULTISPECIES: metal-dependent hydrolase [Vibrio]|uniref:Alanyl-tRNA editing protein n=1 Tax=Vibrio kanaloae TaxID=170673 RepID=A0ABV4LDU7_9VIBR|nr:metal-dependent hydrolase [Vibrio kanaloae]OEF12254.1 metal-dependent hydrolase [Vibrio kanaloae 5S-149]QPK04999.1 alanyl-tRNA editing protein [Vibrio kanaloae]TKF06021.1 alanyl-tRNA editing protein [Vibrio kanaloae]TKF64307.1 alanyl-tRNA editing protein [Vibrio kanaloae]TKF78789.1 alanyl-tRNA editing protein [Vibrio kanaloae]
MTTSDLITQAEVITPTITQFCHQIWQLNAKALHVESDDSKTYLITDVTPFHPVSHIWPDHPADQGFVTVDDVQYPVEDCLVGAIEQSTGKLCIAADIPVKRDAEGWVFVVVHQLSASASMINIHDEIVLSVDKEYQSSLSRGHSAGHIASLALNKVLAESYWRKDADRKDPLGSYDFNSYAQVTSFVTQELCTDKYRLGKTLKKRGLNVADLLANLDGIETDINQMISGWLAEPTPVAMRLEGEALTDSRYWEWQLDADTLVSIPCGGTHIENTSELKALSVKLTQLDDQHIEMLTHVIR